jgi:microcin C transport system substrate-binding protein
MTAELTTETGGRMNNRANASRRFMAAVAVVMAGLTALVLPAAAQDQKRHALSLVGEPKYPADFKHFAWVNPDAPKGGRVRRYADGTFDSFNPWPIQGQTADVPGSTFSSIYDQLFASSIDEASTEYAHVAAWASYPADYSSATFELRPEARFHDGKPITPEDVIFSLETLRKINPRYNVYYKDIEKAEKTGERQVTFRFSVKYNRELPHIISQITVLPKHWWEANGPDGKPRDISKSSLEPPLASGPYKIKSFQAGREVTYERVKDWWAKDLPIMKGQYNFDEWQIIYFRERLAAFEAFKAGSLDYWRENSAKGWATDYEFDAVKKGWVKRVSATVQRVTPMQGYYMNLRRKTFQDPRVRRALNLAFDFEWANKNVFYDLYTRTNSYFDNSELASKGLPTGRELEILNEVKGKVPAEVFTTEWKNPVSDGSGNDRKTLSEAVKLFTAAGYTPKSGVLTNAAGEQLAFEILLDGASWDRIVQPYKSTLEKLGVKVTIRQVDSAQYKRRTDTFDYDMIVDLIAQSESPGNEQREFWGSVAAKTNGSRNSLGLADPAVDQLIEKVVFAKDRAELIAATKALDRVMLWGHYVVPHWYSDKQRHIMWDQFAGPKVQPARDFGFFQTWWWDDAAAAKLKAARGN